MFCLCCFHFLPRICPSILCLCGAHHISRSKDLSWPGSGILERHTCCINFFVARSYFFVAFIYAVFELGFHGAGRLNARVGLIQSAFLLSSPGSKACPWGALQRRCRRGSHQVRPRVPGELEPLSFPLLPAPFTTDGLPSRSLSPHSSSTLILYASGV